jgi:hypothetical protein
VSIAGDAPAFPHFRFRFLESECWETSPLQLFRREAFELQIIVLV